MRKFLALLLLLGFMAFPAVAGATTTEASEDVNLTVSYRIPLSLNVAVQAGTLYIGKLTSTGAGVYIWQNGSGWDENYVSCNADIGSNGFDVFQISGSPDQDVQISVGESTLTLTNENSDYIRLETLKICLASDGSLHEGTSNCCGSGTTYELPHTINLGSSGSGHFAIIPNRIVAESMANYGWFTGTLTVTADYQ